MNASEQNANHGCVLVGLQDFVNEAGLVRDTMKACRESCERHACGIAREALTNMSKPLTGARERTARDEQRESREHVRQRHVAVRAAIRGEEIVDLTMTARDVTERQEIHPLEKPKTLGDPG